MKLDNAPLDAVKKRLSEALKMSVQLACKRASVETLTMDFGRLSQQAALKTMAHRGTRPNAVWRVTIGPLPSDT